MRERRIQRTEIKLEIKTAARKKGNEREEKY